MSDIRLGCKLKLSVTAAGSGQRTAAYGATEIERERRGCAQSGRQSWPPIRLIYGGAKAALWVGIRTFQVAWRATHTIRTACFRCASMNLCVV
jgi:hypothetical protein